MKRETQRDVINRISEKHVLENNGLIIGQCLRTDGRVRGTVPPIQNEYGIVELSMDDTSGGSIAVGVALSGRRPIYVVRFQGFQWYNAPEIVNYAAKSKEMWGVPCPVFVRSIALDGGVGPVASGSHHSLFTRMPGISVCSPMTPKEYETIWNHFMKNDDPMYVSEHRNAWTIDHETEDKLHSIADVTLLPISSTRFNAIEASNKLEEQGIKCNLIHLLWLKPFELNHKTERIRDALHTSKYGGIVIDGDYENGIAKCIAYDLMYRYSVKVKALGLEEKAAGFAPHRDNIPPTPKRIYNEVFKLMGDTLDNLY